MSHIELASAAQRDAGNGGDHRLADLADGLPVAGNELRLVDIHVRAVRHRAHVGAGGESALAAGDHDGADRLVVVESAQCMPELIHKGVVERVELAGPVQRHDADAAAGFGENVFVGHRGSSVAS
jgi:hypothetical protein